MAVRRSSSATLKNSTNNNFRIQTSRSVTTIRGTPTWKPSGVCKQPPFDLYIPPETVEKPKIPAFQGKPWNFSRKRKYSAPGYIPPETVEKPKISAVQGKPWNFSRKRKYSFPAYIPIETYNDIKPKSSEPIWHPPGRYIHERPPSLSPVITQQKPIHEPVWRPAGKVKHKPVPYFDPPNARWSLQQLIKSTPDLRTKTPRKSRSAPVTKSQYLKDS